jgi:3-oxoacyl-[acyl-carrier-protein] synthase II
VTIVLTGVGAVTALGASAEETWRRLVNGERGLRELTLFEDAGYRTKIVAEVDGLPTRDGKDFSRTSELALRAARAAIADAQLDVAHRRVGLVVGGSTAGMFETESLLAVLLSREGTVDPEARKRALVAMLGHPLNAPTDRVARELGPFVRVRSLSSACSSGANAIVVGATWLSLGLVDAVVCGAADALCRVTLAGFNALAALDPEGARPFDKRRRGLTLGEGAGFVVLERAGEAKKDAICTLLGWSARSEAHHITNPEPSGREPMRAMAAAMLRGGVSNDDVDYVNAHGTGTPLNDPMESRALAGVLGAAVKRVPVSSQKGQIGHTLAAAGAIEAVITAMSIARSVIPPTGGLEEPDPDCALVHVTKAIETKVGVAVSSSFGFGGMDTVLVFGARDCVSPPPPKPRGVVVTGTATVGPFGLFSGEQEKDLGSVMEELRQAGLPADPTFRLVDPVRGRRLDRASRLAAGVTSRATEKSVDREMGIIVGSAFGAVDATSAFMRRLREKGARLVKPAEFPSLVPSAPAGHVSIYLGLGGPAFVVADLAASGECAFTQAWELVAAGEADRMAAVAVEERSAIVEEIFTVLFAEQADSRAPRLEGAAAIALAAEGAPGALARIESLEAWTDPSRARIPPAISGGRVYMVTQSAEIDALLAASGWAGAERLAVAHSSGTHEAAGGIAIAVAAEHVSQGVVPAALALGTARGSGYAVLLRPCAKS